MDWFGHAQQWLFEGAVQPLMFAIGLGGVLEDGYQATGWLLVGVLQLAVMVTAFAALERWWPAEAQAGASAGAERHPVRTDIVYTLIHRLGLFRVLIFFSIDPLWDTLVAQSRLAGVQPWQLDALWPGITDLALVSFVLYLLLFDLLDYGLHRAQHGLHWWWQLHALHHSQQRMTVWSDNRNHLLDDVLRDSAIVLLALLVGIAPGQFVAVVAATQLLESLSHANTRIRFGPVLGRLLVSPRFHRLHHGIGVGHESHGPGSLGGHNFGVLFPFWDALFGTAHPGSESVAIGPTGIRDQLEGRDYGSGFVAQQWLGLTRLAGALRPGGVARKPPTCSPPGAMPRA